jgi:hypothetical protein
VITYRNAERASISDAIAVQNTTAARGERSASRSPHS